MLEGRGPVVDALPEEQPETYQPGNRVPGWIDETN